MHERHVLFRSSPQAPCTAASSLPAGHAHWMHGATSSTHHCQMPSACKLCIAAALSQPGQFLRNRFAGVSTNVCYQFIRMHEELIRRSRRSHRLHGYCHESMSTGSLSCGESLLLTVWAHHSVQVRRLDSNVSSLGCCPTHNVQGLQLAPQLHASLI